MAKIIGGPKPGNCRARQPQRSKRWRPISSKPRSTNMRADRQAEYLATTFEQCPLPAGAPVFDPNTGAPLHLMVVVGVVLLIACANVANLLLARGAGPPARNRHPHGPGLRPRALIRQLLTESLLLSLSGAALGMFFAQWGRACWSVSFPRRGRRVFLDLAIDGRMLAFTAGVAILTGLLFGLAPAWRGTASSRKPP